MQRRGVVRKIEKIEPIFRGHGSEHNEANSIGSFLFAFTKHRS